MAEHARSFCATGGFDTAGQTACCYRYSQGEGVASEWAGALATNFCMRSQVVRLLASGVSREKGDHRRTALVNSVEILHPESSDETDLRSCPSDRVFERVHIAVGLVRRSPPGIRWGCARGPVAGVERQPWTARALHRLDPG